MPRNLSEEEQQALAEMRSAFKHEEFLPWLRQQVWQWCVQRYRLSGTSEEGRNAQHPNVQKELQRHRQERPNRKCLEGMVPISGGEDLGLLDCCALAASFWDIYGVVPQVIRENDLEDIPTPAVAFWATKMVVGDAAEADLRGIGGVVQETVARNVPRTPIATANGAGAKGTGQKIKPTADSLMWGLYNAVPESRFWSAGACAKAISQGSVKKYTDSAVRHTNAWKTNQRVLENERLERTERCREKREGKA